MGYHPKTKPRLVRARVESCVEPVSDSGRDRGNGDSIRKAIAVGVDAFTLMCAHILFLLRRLPDAPGFAAMIRLLVRRSLLCGPHHEVLITVVHNPVTTQVSRVWVLCA